jgi:hypothetical protein
MNDTLQSAPTILVIVVIVVIVIGVIIQAFVAHKVFKEHKKISNSFFNDDFFGRKR